MAASNKDLNQLVKENKFREDLFYRIVQAQIFLSPLRERGSDILLLARHFLNEFSSKNRAQKHFGDQAERKLLAYKYPGNVRQLKNIVKLAYIHSRTELIEAADIHLHDISEAALEVEIPPEGIDLERDIIPAYYQAAMKLAKNNASEAARLLGLKPHTFRARLKALAESK